MRAARASLSLLLLVFAAFLSAQEPLQDAQAIPQDGTRSEAPSVPGQAQYLEASKILNTIQSPKRRLARYYKPTSFLGSVQYYSKEAFVLLFMNGPKRDARTSQKMSQPLMNAVDLLKVSANEGYLDAIYTLAEINFYGLYTHPRNFTDAFLRYQALADTEGNSTAQHMLGFFYATGMGGVVEKDQARSLLYHSFAADAGDLRSQMTTGYRHHAGISAPRNCEKSVVYYKEVADEAMRYVRSGPPGGHAMLKELHRLADEDGGIYGEGASVTSSGINAKNAGPQHEANAAFDDVLEYLDLMSRKGELKAIFSLGRLHYEGSRALQRNYRIAADKFFDVARRYWDKSGKIRPDTEPGVDRLASKAAGYLGRMFLRGEGLEQNFQIAQVWFKRGIQNGDELCQYSMGIMHLHGLGMPKNPVRAAEFLGAAADQDWPAAQVRLGALFMDQGDLNTAVKYFELAARKDHIEAFYYLADMLNQGAGGMQRNCNQAALYYKKVAEKAEVIHSNFGEANDAYEDGDYETALLLYMMGAEQGYEAAQANVAHLLDRFVVQPHSQISRFFSTFIPTSLQSLNIRLPFLSSSLASPTPKLFGDAALALIYWTRSAKGGNVDSLLKLGDYYLAGLGIPPTAPTNPKISLHHSSSSSSSPITAPPPDSNSTTSAKDTLASKAATCYSAASETLQSAQALFNLGWMHENGIGVSQDFHLAKRYYDAAAEPPMREARAPVAIALMKLRVRGWWNWVTRGDVRAVGEGSERGMGEKERKTFWEWFREFLAADAEMERVAGEHEHGHGNDADAATDSATQGYMDEWGESLHGGYNRRQQRRRMYDDNDDEEDEWDDLVGGWMETFVIVSLAGMLAALVWFRQMQNLRQRAEVERRRREEVRRGVQQGAEVGGGAALFTGSGDGARQEVQSTSATSAGTANAVEQTPQQQAQQQPQDQPQDPPSPSTASPPPVQQSETEPNDWSFVDVPSGNGQEPPEPSNPDPSAPGGSWSAGPGGVGH